jgi:glycosyltransferase involved in cell wall biosynthesis
MIWLAYFIYGSLVLRFLVVVSNLFTAQWLKHSGSKTIPDVDPAISPMVSVLIPARNEETKIGTLLNDLLKQDYENIEILIYDDLSEDNTTFIVRRISKGNNKIRLLQGEPLPAGWVGKNHACHRLALEAKGEFLLFLDADVRVKSSLITNGLIHVQQHQLDLLSVFPKQIMKTFGEKITVPVMNWVLTGLLPLILTRISSWPSFSAANGQFMLFRADTYNKYRFHEKVKDTIVEDINIFRQMKRAGLRTHTILSNGDISCRMYNSWSDATEGFSRNVTEFFGGYSFVAVLYALLTTLGFIPVIIYLPTLASASFFALAILHRMVISSISRQPVFENLLLSPLQQISFCSMIIKAIRNRANNATTWKGRVISNQQLKTRVT